mmetsp:Transcript_326/g.491  ORF Transcript_326/g.491 Transcript_326/m.491 type:complete len:503 (+) Transcript_326:185-1693(+)
MKPRMDRCLLLSLLRLSNFCIIQSFSVTPKHLKSQPPFLQPSSLCAATSQNINDHVDDKATPISKGDEDTNATSLSLDKHELPKELVTKQYFTVIDSNEPKNKRKWNILRRRKQQEGEKSNAQEVEKLRFDYDYDELILSNDESNAKKMTGIILIHPIGVGISKWFYHRLIKAMAQKYNTASHDKNGNIDDSYMIIVPDLLGSGTAVNPTTKFVDSNEEVQLQKLPLLNITDWSSQISHLLNHVERQQYPHYEFNWCVVANGGCSPIALQVAAASCAQRQQKSDDGDNKMTVQESANGINAVTNVVLSSVPRLPFFLQPSNDPIKTAKSYTTLSGVPGKLFWWYSCRNNGSFIRKFSEKNLVANANNLGENWQRNCFETAISNGGKSKYGTFAFLAGALQDGCYASLEYLKNTNVKIDVIKGQDVRRNNAKSWFWLKKKRSKKGHQSASKENDDAAPTSGKTIVDYLKENGNGGRERMIRGRISLAHEDANGYAESLFDFLK